MSTGLAGAGDTGTGLVVGKSLGVEEAAERKEEEEKERDRKVGHGMDEGPLMRGKCQPGQQI